MGGAKLTAAAAKAWDIAAVEAAASKSGLIEKEHVLIGIMSLDKAMDSPDSGPIKAERDAVQNVLDGASDRPVPHPAAVIRRSLRKAVEGGAGPARPGVLHRSAECRAVFRRAGELSRTKSTVSCLHLLAAILEGPGPAIEASLAAAGIRVRDLVEPVGGWIAILEGEGGTFPDLRNGLPAAVDGWLGPAHGGYLEKYGRDLTHDAAAGRLGPFSGRKKELLQIIQVLGRHTKNNPVLLGEAGVGKTAIVEALAVRMARGKDPHVLGGKRLIQLSMAAMVANTKYRGDLEERLTGVLDEAISDPGIVLFIDEVHTIVGAGRSDGSALDASNIIKPYLVRGLRCIGTSTLAEYHRYVESDPALERRFETILVEEPCREEALAMLEALRPGLEEHHGVRILGEAVEAAVDLSMRFDAEHMLPDKAVDLLDMACSGARIPSLSMGSLEELRPQVDAGTIAATLARSAGVPAELAAAHLESPSTSRLLELEGFLKKRLVGQEEASGRVSRRLMVAYSGIEKQPGPLAVFLFTGPTGVGKTEMARLLAEFLFGNASEMIRLDLSEYSEENSVARLIGSPPGYIGYEEDGLLVRMLRARPYTVALFDEAEKAHPRVFDVFLQLFDEGRITDSRGRTADARNTIFILTSNLEPGRGSTYDELEEGIPRRPGKGGLEAFRPEFVNRIDEIVAFRPLDTAAIRRLMRGKLDEVLAELEQNHHVTLRLSGEAEDFLAAAGYNPEYGARELRRVVRNFVYVPLSSLILTGRLKAHGRWLAVYGESGISIVPDDT